MTRKRFEKLLMSQGWPRNRARCLIATLRQMRKVGVVTLSYAEQWELYTTNGEFRLEIPF